MIDTHLDQPDIAGGGANTSGLFFQVGSIYKYRPGLNYLPGFSKCKKLPL